MNRLKEYLKDKNLWFYIETAAALLALVTSIYYVVQSNADNCFNIAVFLLLLAGIAAVTVGCFLDFEFIKLIAGAAWGTALGIIIHDMMPTLSDVWNGINFIGGNLTAYVTYTVLIGVTALIGIVCGFFGHRKTIVQTNKRSVQTEKGE